MLADHGAAPQRPGALSRRESMKMLRAFVRAVWTICKKDVRVWLRQPPMWRSRCCPPSRCSQSTHSRRVAVGRSPVALVTLDHGVKGAQMAQIIHQADVFRVSDATPAQAQVSVQQPGCRRDCDHPGQLYAGGRSACTRAHRGADQQPQYRFHQRHPPRRPGC